jgi:hypothetical protein
MLSGQAAMFRRRNVTDLTNPFSVSTLSKLLHLMDALTLSTYLDAADAGPYFLQYLLRLVPPKLPIDLRPVMLRIVHRLAVGMARDRRPEGRCFDERTAIGLLHALNPILENPRSGASASFVMHEIKAVVETCMQRTMGCPMDREPFRFTSPKLDFEFGMVESEEVPLQSLCGFQVPSLLGISPSTCLGYRCSITRSNLMRNGSIDSNLLELSFRNATQILAPSFRSRSINFTLPLSPEFSKRIQKGGRPLCVWYEREANATVSRWSDAGCSVRAFNRTHVSCTCTHLTEFAVMIPEVRRPLKLQARWWLFACLLSLVSLTGALAVWSLHRRHVYESEVAAGKREPKHLRRFHGPITLQEHIRRRQWRLRDSDEDTLFDELDSAGKSLSTLDNEAVGKDDDGSDASTIDGTGTLVTRTLRTDGPLSLLDLPIEPSVHSSLSRRPLPGAGTHNSATTPAPPRPGGNIFADPQAPPQNEQQHRRDALVRMLGERMLRRKEHDSDEDAEESRKDTF